MENTAYILADDLELIKEQLQLLPAYDFSKDLAGRMKKQNLSQLALAARLGVSHATVGKWLKKSAKPHSKERFKELGIALGMDEQEVNTFLLANCYPRLYTKNPLDAACRLMLSEWAGDENAVKVYKEFLAKCNYDTFVLYSEPVDISTGALSHDLGFIKSLGQFEAWLNENNKRFRAFDKLYIPHAELIRFILLYIGEQTINDLYITGDLPVTIKNLLYPLLADKEIAVRGLRAKLIVFGLYKNMNEHEIDIMLNIAKLQPITRPFHRIDNVILTALRCAHERYPYFENNNANEILNGIEGNLMPDLRGFYEEQRLRSGELIKYYEKSKHKSVLDRMFEEVYTDYNDSGILNYSRDIIKSLIEDNSLTDAEVAEYMALIKTY